MGTVVVVGGVNQDVTVRVDRRPDGGETVVGDGPLLTGGGKGANQAVAAARAGATTRLCAVVGEDPAGTEQLRQLADAGVDVSGVRRCATATGTALILLTPDGENSIVVGAGANALLDADDVAAATAAGADVVLVQTEPGPAPSDAAARAAVAAGCRVVVNAAPVESIDRALLAHADPLVVNEHEAADLLGEAVARAEEVAARLRESLGCPSVVVSLGASGAFVADAGGGSAVPAPRVAPVDTTGAGDVLVGTVAAALAGGQDLVEAVRLACRRAAEAVTRPGAR